MSAIKDGRMPIELNGKMYHMLFSLNAIDEIEDRFGDIGNITEIIEGKGRMKDLRWLFTLLINEGAPDGEEQLTEKQVGKLIHSGNLAEITTAIYKTFVYGNTGSTEIPDVNDADDIDVSDEENDEGNAQAGEDG
jgi:hypothetical protein